jgi:hypothetical protein
VATTVVLVSAGVVALVAARPGSPLTPPLYPGAQGFPPLVWLSRFLGLDELSRDAVGVVGAAALFAAAGSFLYALVQAWHGRLPVRRVLLVAVLLHALALAVPLFLSRDVYSYAIYGRMVSQYGANPYAEIPGAFATDPTYSLVSVDWIDSPSVYGPAFTVVATAVTATAESPASIVHAFKVVAAAASLGTVLLALAAARRAAPERAAFAAVLIGWNPVVVFHGVAGGHNDALLGLAVTAAILAILARRELWGTAALALAALVKVSGGVPLLVAVAAATIRRPKGTRLRTFGLHAAIGVAVALPFVLPFMQAEDPTLGTLELTSRQGWLAPSRFVLVMVRGAAGAFGDVAYDVASLVVRLAFPLLFAWVVVALVRHLAGDRDRLDPLVVVGAMGWASLLSLLISPVLLPWYIAWVIPLAWLLPRTARGGAVLVSVALAITELLAEPSRSPELWEAMVFGLHWVATPIVLLVLVRLLLDLRRRLALPPGSGLSSPLLVEDPVSLGGPGGGTPALTAAAPRRGVARGSEKQGGDDSRRATRPNAEPVGQEGGHHRHGDPD